MNDAIRKEYQLSKTSIQMHQAKLIKVDIEQMVPQVTSSSAIDFQIFYRTDELDDRKRQGIMSVVVVIKDEEAEEIQAKFEMAYRGIFVCEDSSITPDDFKRFVEIQTVPQLLPHIRATLTMISAQMDLPIIELPTMDIIASIAANGSGDESEQ